MLLFFVLFSVLGVQGQVTVSSTGGNGTGNGSYTTLGAAFSALGTTATGVVTVTITGNTTEAVGGASLGAGAWTSLTIAPSGGSWTVSGAATAGTPLITFNGADNVTVNGGGNLTFSNTTASATSGTSTLKLVADATNNTFNGVTILGSGFASTGSNTANVWISTATTTGNDNNSFQSCKFGPAGTNYPSQLVIGNGTNTSSTTCNSNVTFNNCEFYDYFLAGGCMAINAGSGNTDWNITNNKVYQTASRAMTSTMSGFVFSNSTFGNNLQITGNTIGYASNSGTGTLTLTGTGSFTGISFTLLSTAATTSNVNSNIISDISLTSSTGTFTGINNSTSASSNTININSNTIRNITNIGSTGAMQAISAGSATTLNCNSNTINNMTRNTGGVFYGIIYTSPTTGTFNLNTISNLSSTSTSSTSAFYGIYSVSSPPNEVWTNNTIDGLTSSSTGSQTIIGIYNVTSTSGNKTCQNNTVKNLSLPSTSTGSIYGIRVAYLGAANEVSGNNVNTLTGGTTVYGIQTGSSSAAAVSVTNIFKNKVYGLSSSVAGATVNGIYISAGSTNNLYNNIVGGLTASAATGSNAVAGIYLSGGTTDNVYYNTVYLNGTSSGSGFGSSAVYAATTPTVDLRNNIFDNATVATGSGLAVAYRRSSTTLTSYASTSNNNMFFGSTIYTDGTNTDATFGAYQTRVSTRDTASKSQNPTFANTATGSLSTYLNFANGAINLAGGTAQVISGYATDYAGTTRDASAPDMGAYEFAQGSIAAPTISGYSTAYSSNPVLLCVNGGSVVTITGTGFDTVTAVYFHGSGDPSGVNTLAGTITGSTTTTLTVTSPANAVDGSITVVNPGGPATSGSTYAQALTPTVGVSSGVTVCAGTPTTLTATGAATYGWSPSLGLNGTTGDTVTATPSATTTYTVTGTSSAGCTATNTVTVTVSTTPAVITAASTKTNVCIGGSASLSTSSGSLATNVAEGFETFPPSGWTFINAGTGNPWATYTTAHTGTKSMYCLYTSANAANAWAISPGQNLVAGITYSISYWYTTGGGYTESLKLTVGTTNTVAAQTTTLLNQPSLTNTTYTQATATFTPSTTGTYYFGLNCYSIANQYYIAVDDFAISGSIPATYAWTSTPSGFTSSVQNPGTVSPTVSTTYTVTATIGSCSTTSSVAVGVNPLPTIGVNNAATCTGGAGATLTATGGTSYAWSPATGLSAATGASVTATPGSTQVYTVTGTDANTCQNTATATVTVNNAVVITTQPANQVVIEGTDATFTVAATGTGLSYQWEEFDGTWNTLAGATSASYTVVAAAATSNTHQFRCIVSGTSPCSPVTTNAATLTVGNVSISSQPVSQTVCSNTDATFTITASGTVTSYQWQYTTNGTNWFDVPGQTAASLVLSGTTSANTGTSFRCVLNGSLNSNSASLTVYDAIVIGTQPTNQAICSTATSVAFTAAATGSGAAYQWQMSTNGTSWSNVGTNSGTYTISSPTPSMNGNQYRVVVSGTSPCGAVTSDVATLTVTNVTVAASSASICIGSPVTLTATFTGAPGSPTSSWQSVTTGSGAETAVSGATATVTPTAAGTYVYTFTTNGTCSFTRTTSVTVNPLPAITTATATPTALCSGSTINLAATSVTNANGSASLGAGGSTSTLAGINPFYGGYGGVKTQFIIKASELTALGFAAGNITSLGLDLTTAGSTLSGFALSIDHTSLTALTSNIETVANTVYSGSFVPAVGVNTITFASPFAWNGTSNIILSFCWSNNNTSNTVSTVKVDAPGFTSSNARYVDSRTSSEVCSYTGSTTPSGWNGSSTTGSSRPKFVITGNKATSLTSNYTWSWSPGAVTGATATTSVTNASGAAVNQAFTATATSAAGCSSSLTTSTVKINSTIPTPTGADSTQCGTKTPTCSVTGTGTSGNTFHWYTVSTNGTAISGQTGSTLVSPYTIAATTTFYVSEVSADGLCESPRVAVIATVTNPYAFTLSSGTATNCSGFASLTPVTIATNGGYDTYSWSNSATVSGNETTGWTFSPTATTTYTLTATGGGCSTTATVAVTPVALPVVAVTASPAAVCVGASSTLTAQTSVIAAGIATIGAGASSSTTYHNPFYGLYSNIHSQHIILASELTASGLKAGNITALSMNFTTANTAALLDLKVKIGSTTATSASAFVTDATTTVYTNSSFQSVVGTNTFAFSTPFNWDGTSNIMLEFCYGNAATTTTNTSVVSLDNTSYVSSNYFRNTSAIDGATACSSNTVTGSYSAKPQFKLSGQVATFGVGTLAYAWNDPAATTGNVLTVTPSATTTYTVSGYNSTTGCTGTATGTVTVYAPPTAPVATNGARCGTGVVTTATVADSNGYTTPTFKWYADNTTTTALQSSTSTSYTTSISATTTFYVSVLSPGGCESGRTAITATVNTPATLTVSTAAIVCAGQSTTLTASGAATYTWSPALGLNGTTSASVIATPSATTTYSVTGVDANGCTTAAATVLVTVKSNPTTVSIAQGAGSVCVNGVMSLTASGGNSSASANVTLGTGITTTSVQGVTPFGSNYEGSRQQYLVKASELNALGLSAGPISSVAFTVTAASNYAQSNFTIKMAKTNDTAITGAYGTPVGSFTTVYTTASLPIQTVGLKTFAFSTPFTWDGTSNVLIDICHDNDINATCSSCFSTSGTVAYTATSFNSVFGSYADNVQSCGLTAASVLSSTYYTYRPNMIFGGVSQTIPSFTWSPSTDLYTTSDAGTAYTGGATPVVYVKPSGGAVTYTATASNGTCAISTTTTVTPNPQPVFSLTNAIICRGSSTTLTVTGTGSNYAWSPTTGLSNISTNGATVTAAPTTTTTYTVTATDTTTGCQSSHTVTVTVSEPGAILTSGTTTAQTVVPGQQAVFTVATASGVTYTYQWQENSGSGWANISDDYVAPSTGHYLGTQTATLTIDNIGDALDTHQYQCIVTGTSPCAALTPIAGTLTVSSTGISQQPADVTLCSSSTASFSITTSGDDPYGIQWQMSTDNGVTYTDIADGLDTTTGLTFLGVDTTTLQVSTITVANNNVKFLCFLNFFLPSQAATLSVKNPVVITGNPSDQTVCASGGTATFTGAATGDNLAYQWQFSTNGGASWASYIGTGANTTSITLTNPAIASDGTKYRLLVNGNAACTSATTTVATLHINNPTITAEPASAIVLRGNAATFTVGAASATTYQWQRSTTLNGTYSNVVDNTPTGNTYSDATTATLTVTTSATTATDNANFYRCIVSNGGCTATSKGGQLTVNYYCTPAMTTVSASGDYINNFTFADISNDASGDTATDYTYYDALTANVTAGGNYPISITAGGISSTYAMQFRVWIDFNHNGSFADAGESVFATSAATFSPTAATGTVSIPYASATVLTGVTRMRVAGRYSSVVGAGAYCLGESTYGEFEDYNVNILPTPACTSGDLVAGTASTALSSLCAGNTGTTVSLAGSTSGVFGVTYQWQYSTNGGSTWTNASGASATTTALSTGAIATGSTSFKCISTCSAGGSVESNVVTVTAFDPQLTGSTPAGRCGTGTVTLGATANAGADVGWYAAATGGSTLGTGTSFTTPSIAATTTYYAEANIGVSTVSGLGNTSIPTATGASSERGIVFTVATNGTIVSAQYYSPTLSVTNTVTVRLVNNATGTQVGSSLVLPIVQGTTAGFYTMNLNLAVTAGTTYRLLAGFTQSVNRISSGADYTSAAYSNLTPIGTITSGYDSGITTASYNYFHNIVVTTSGCSATRTAVVATVTPKPTATISYAGSPFCSTAGIGSVTLNGTNAYTGGTFSSTSGLAIDSTTGAIDVAGSTPGTYTVTYTTNAIGNCGAQTATSSVTINQALTSTFAYDAATYCSNAGTVTPTISGSAGTFTAAPAGLSINAATGVITLATSAAGTYTVTNTVVVAGCSNSVSTASVTVTTAVAITTQPISASALPGDNVTFTSAATGTGIAYQWQVNDGSGWADLSGQTAASLALSAVTIGMNGYQYRVVVSGAGSCAPVTSSVATLTVDTAAISVQPVNATACSFGADTASFSVTTTGTVTSYQWQVSTNGTTWTDISNGGIYANADTATLLLSGLGVSNTTWSFRVKLNGGNVISNAATLTVNTAVAISTQPAAATACSGGGASFFVVASGTSLTYQWQVSTNGTTWNAVSGATTATLTLSSLLANTNGNQYRVIISGASPCGAVTSNPAVLTTNTVVAVTTPPASATVCNAANAIFTVATSGTSPTYQWQMSTNGTTYTDVSGATSATLTVSGVTLGMNGYKYRAVVSGAAPCGTATSSAATLTVSQPAVPTITPSTTDFCPGSIVTLTAGNISVNSYSNSFDVLPSSFTAATVSGTTTTSATLSTTYQAEGTGSVLFNTTGTSSVATYSMNTNVNLAGISNVQLTFSHQAIMESPTTSFDYGYVEYSADGGTTWVTFPATSYSGSAASTVFTGGNARFTTKSYPDWITNFTSLTSLPNNTLWKAETFTIPAAALTSQFRIRFRYTTDSSTNYYGWLIDNVKISVPNASTTWSPSAGLYTNAGATTAYGGGNATTVYAKPTDSTVYTVTTANGLGCTNSNSVSLHLMTPSTLSSVTQPSITCSGSQTTFNLTGLLPSSTSTINYTVNGVAQTAITGVVANASGNGSFTVALSAVNNGKTLAITSITRTDLTPSCSTAITANNTVVIAVQPLVTYYADADGDGFGNSAVTQITCQGQPSGYVTNSTDCDDADATKHASYPFYADTDGDGYGAGSAVSLCAVNATTPPAGYSVNNTDCAPTDATKHASYSFYTDADGDGYGTGSLVSVCAVDATTPPTGYSVNNTDCNDSDAASNANTTTTSNVTACDSYTWSINGSTYTASGTYSYVVNSCHTEVLNLTISCSSVVNIKLNIQGYYDTATHAMRPVSLNQGVGTSSTDVDDITVELRDSSSNALVANATAKLLTNGNAQATFTTAPSGSFYLAIKYRNAVQTWSAVPVTVGATPVSYDFTTAANKAMGDNQIQLESGVYGIYSGDLNQDDNVDGFDYSIWLTDYNDLAFGYYASDLNGDGNVDGFDYSIWLSNYNNLIYSIHP